MAKRRAKADKRTAKRRSNYAWHRRIPWAAVIGGGVLLIGAVLVARQVGLIGSVGRYVAGSGVGDHRPVGQPIAYPSYPPTSGTHWEAPASWGFHTEPVADEYAVHNLEHGGVVASYNNISASDLARLQALLTTYPRDKYGEVKLVIRPYDKIAPGALVLTAWNWIDELSSYNESEVRAFMDSHIDRCCEDVP